jgi:hypothetical protein
VAVYSWVAEAGAYLPFALDTLTLDADHRIAEVTAFITRSTDSRDPEFYARWPAQPLDPGSAAAFERFGLPSRLD